MPWFFFNIASPSALYPNNASWLYCKTASFNSLYLFLSLSVKLSIFSSYSPAFSESLSYSSATSSNDFLLFVNSLVLFIYSSCCSFNSANFSVLDLKISSAKSRLKIKLVSTQKWNQIVFVLLWKKAYLTERTVFKVHPHWTMYQDFILFSG